MQPSHEVKFVAEDSLTYRVQLPPLNIPSTPVAAVPEPIPSGTPQPQYYVVIDSPPKRAVYGSVQWKGYVAKPVPGPNKGKFEILGSIVDPISGNTVGAITLTGESIDGDPQFSDGDHGHVTENLYAALSGGAESLDYWKSIQSCDLTSAAQIQGAVRNASDTNNLFKLTNTERLRLQQ